MLACGVAFLIFVLLATVIMQWVNYQSISELREKIERLQGELILLKKVDAAPFDEPAPAKTVPFGADEAEPSARDRASAPFTWDAHSEDKKVVAFTSVPGKKTNTPATPRSRDSRTGQPRNFEQQFGGQAFVWLGGIALALAGFYLVKYSVESGLLNEKVRVILGLIFGIALLAGSHVIRRHPRFSDGTRISQALAGAGIADLYGCLFAATSLYHLTPLWLGFTSMAAVTAIALILSLRYGAPIATLGLLGGFVTPLILHSASPNTLTLCGYLYLVFGGFCAVTRRQRWWGLSILATAASFLWVAACLLNGLRGDDSAWISLFLLGISATVVATTRGVPNDASRSLSSYFRYATLGGSLVMMTALAYRSHFDTFVWAMFAILSIAAVILAWCDDDTYGFAPWAAMAATTATLLIWDCSSPGLYAAILTGFCILFFSSSYFLMMKSKIPTLWAGLCAVSATLYFLLAYYRLNASLTAALPAHSWLSAHRIFALVAFALTAFFVQSTRALFTNQNNIVFRHQQQTIFAVAATGLLALGFGILFNQEYWNFAIACEILTLCWIDNRVDIPSLRMIAKTLTGVFGVLLIPALLSMVDVPELQSYAAAKTNEPHNIINMVFGFALPALVLAAASWLSRAKLDDQYVAVLEAGSIGLFGIAGYDLIGIIFVGNNHHTAYIERALYNDFLLLTSLAALRVGRCHLRTAVEWSGVVLGAAALLRIVAFDFLFENPLWSDQLVGAWPILNGLILSCALPALLILLIKTELASLKRDKWASSCNIAGYLLAFAFISLNVRQFYHGSSLDTGSLTSGEIYAYSAAWLLFGIALLVLGTLRHDRVMRVMSLLVLLMTVGKVFLYDASQLTGLWRVFSFFGLGLCLLGLSWFYSRFVFGDQKLTGPLTAAEPDDLSSKIL